MVNDITVSESLVQIMIDDSEVKRRIKSFIDKKREEIDRNNLRDFVDNATEDSCARTSSNVYRIKDSKGHLKIKRVCNEAGPADENLLIEENFKTVAIDGIKERLEDIEAFLRLEPRPVPKDIYERLKAIENEVHYLKTISPEYFHFISEKTLPIKKKIVYTVEDLDKIIDAMENKS